jgi:hypothetical protein
MHPALVLHNECGQLPSNVRPAEVLRITPEQAVMVRHCYLHRSASIGMGERRDKGKRPPHHLYRLALLTYTLLITYPPGFAGWFGSGTRRLWPDHDAYISSHAEVPN